MPKMKTKSGAKKRFKMTASGRIKVAAAGKRHGMPRRTALSALYRVVWWITQQMELFGRIGDYDKGLLTKPKRRFAYQKIRIIQIQRSISGLMGER
jgi:hypothetical protein